MNQRRTLLLTLLLVVITAMNATARKPAAPFSTYVKCLSYDRSTQAAALVAVCRTTWDCSDFEVDFADTGGAAILGPKSFAQPLEPPDSFVCTLQVVIPSNDTTSIGMTWHMGWIAMEDCAYFVTTGSTLVASQGDPSRGRRIAGHMSEIACPGTLLPPPREPKQWSEEERQRRDSVRQVRREERRIECEEMVNERQCDSMRLYEQSPLLDRDLQYITCDSVVYARKRGEYEFGPAGEVIGAYKNRDERLTMMVELVHPDSGFEIIATIRKPEQLEYFKTVACELRATDHPDTYRCRVTKETLHQFVGQKLQWESASVIEHIQKARERRRAAQADSATAESETLDDDSDRPRIRSPVGRTSTGRSYVFLDDFEGDWYNTWEAWDELPFSNGADYWGTSSYKRHSGTQSLWCNGNGDMADPGPIDEWMSAFLLPWESIPTIGYENLYLTFWVWHDIEPAPSFMGFYIDVSPDGNEWSEYYYWRIDGVNQNWRKVSYPLGVWDSAYVRLNVVAGSNPSGFTGVYIDDVAIEGDPLPNLRPYEPAGWESALVITPAKNMTYWDDLYGGEPAYIQCAFANDGPGDAGPFTVAVYCDTTELWSGEVPGLAAFDTMVVRNVGVSGIYSGFHDFSLRVDRSSGPPPVYEVREWFEWDNIEEIEWIWVEEPELTITGTVLYTDPNLTSPDTTRPARGIPVIAWDEDGATDDSMGCAITDDLGRFTIGPISNHDETDMRDVYLLFVAQNGAAYVHDNIAQSAQALKVDLGVDLSSPTHLLAEAVLDSSASPHFYIADLLKIGRDQWLQWRPSELPASVKAVLCDTITGWDHQNAVLWVAERNQRPFPDVFDGDVLLHEYAHYLSDAFDFFDDGGGDHSWEDSTNAPKAASEGFATFFSCTVRGDSLARDYYEYVNQRHSTFVNIESGRQGVDTVYQPGFTRNDSGVYYEAANAGVLWDIFDPTDDDYNNNQIGDTICLGIDPILQTLLDGTHNGSHPDSLMDFWYIWMNDQHLNHEWGMYSVFGEHGITMPCCIDRVGSVQTIPGCDPSFQGCDVGTLTDLLDHLFINYTPLCCFEEADMSPLDIGGVPDGVIDVSDLQVLIDHLFITYQPMPLCPQFIVKEQAKAED